MEKHRLFGSDIVRNGVFQSIEHYILTVQMEKKCSRSDALPDAVKLLEDTAEILRQEISPKGGTPNEKQV